MSKSNPPRQVFTAKHRLASSACWATTDRVNCTNSWASRGKVLKSWGVCKAPISPESDKTKPQTNHSKTKLTKKNTQTQNFSKKIRISLRATGRTRRYRHLDIEYRYYRPRELGAPVRILLRGRTRGGSGSGAKCSKDRSYIASNSLAEILTPDPKVRHRGYPLVSPRKSNRGHDKYPLSSTVASYFGEEEYLKWSPC